MEEIRGIIIGMIPGVFGSLLGGAVAWGVAKQKMKDLERRVVTLEDRSEKNNAVLTLLIERLTRVETKLDVKFENFDRTLETIRAAIASITKIG